MRRITDEALLRRAGLARGFVFGEERPFAQCHAATLAHASDGGLVVAWFGGTYEGHPDVAIWTARRARPTDEGFDRPRIAARIADVAHWNPVLYAIPDGAGTEVLALQFKLGARIRTWRSFIACSRDGGRTFEAARPLEIADSEPRTGRGAVRNKPIRLRSGDWLAGASVEGWRRWEAYFDRSPNGIDGWRATERVAVDRRDFVGRGLIQPTLWESAAGRIHALLRSSSGRIYRSDSLDDGRTWSTARPTVVPNNNSALDVARLEDGSLVLACNPVPGDWAPRTPLSLLFSRDDGESWPWQLDLETGPGEYSYPAIIASGDAITLCYTWNRRRIAWVELRSISSLLAGG